jgi:acyl carrier protein
MREALGNNLELDDDFFEQGCSSLVALQVAARVRETLEVELPLDLQFDARTLREIAQIIEAGMHERRKTAVSAIGNTSDPPVSAPSPSSSGADA